MCGHLVPIRNFERGPHPLEVFQQSGLGRGRGFSYKRIRVSPSVRALVIKKLREAIQCLEYVVESVVVSLLEKTIGREMWIPLTSVVRERRIPIGGVRVERG
jgi:hypothetical protein